MLHPLDSMPAAKKRGCGINKVFNSLHQFLHRPKAVVACDGLFQRAPQQLDFVMPRAVDRQE